MSLGACSGPAESEEGPQSDLREADVARAISTAETSGLSAYRVDVATDGTISIVVGMEAAQGASPAAETRTA